MFHRSVFDNGLTLLTERRKGLNGLSMGVWVKTGSRYEPQRYAGISHFLEHMLFKGTKTRSPRDIAAQVERLGGEINAFTGREYTCFHVLVRRTHAAFGAEILTDILLNSTFDRVELDRERDVVVQEIAMTEENPEEFAFDLFYERVFEGSGLGNNILGSMKSLRRIDRKTLIEYYRAHYRPERLVVSVVGDVSHTEAKRHFARLGRWRPPEAGALFADTASLKPLMPGRAFHPGFWRVPRTSEQAHLVIGMRSVPYNAPDRLASVLLNLHLGVGMSSVLFQELREESGLAYSVYSQLLAFRDTGVHNLYVGTDPGKLRECLKRIESVFERIRREAFPRKELESLKENLKGTILLSQDDVEGRMNNLAKNELFFRDYLPVKDVCRRIDRVTGADLRRVANKTFEKSPRAGILIGPKPPNRLSVFFSKG